MAKAIFTFDEMVYNTVMQGKQIYYEGNLKTIDYIKFEKNTRQVLIVCTDGISFLTSQDEAKEWEVNTIKPIVKPTNPKLK